ncbi:hypothetical protein ACTMU2_29155 [Cupriavidus basilensis]
MKEACRLVRATTKVQRAAVAAVLDEFLSYGKTVGIRKPAIA